MPNFDDELSSIDVSMLSELLSEEDVPTVAEQLNDLSTARSHRLDLGDPIARGGMGTVHIATDRLLQQKVAVKILHRNLETDAASVQRFVTEARITASLPHPNIVPVYDIDHTEGLGVYFTMKLVEGQTLSKIARGLPEGSISSGRLAELLDVVIRVCDALAFAHSRGILHCDLKPANIMIGDFGQVYLMDWGMARRFREDPAPEDGRIYGTVGYMAPEQARSQPLDPRSDVFGVGAILYYLFAHTAPFRRKLLEQSLYAAMNSKRKSIAEAAPHCPSRLQTIIEKAMDPDPTKRYASASELRNALARYLRGKMDFPRRRVPAGVQIIREGDWGDSAYILVSGRCEVYRFLSGERRTLRILEPGTIFGETAILARSQRTANVVTLKDCKLLEVTREVLEQELQEMKPWMGVLLKTLARYFHERETARR